MTNEETPKPKRTRPDLVTGRTKPWGTKLSPEWVERIADICHRDRIKANDLVERAIEAYERERASGDLITRLRALIDQASPDEVEAVAKLLKVNSRTK